MKKSSCMRIIALFLGVLLAGNMFGQPQAEKPSAPTDTLFRLGGKKFPIIYKQETATTVAYALPRNPDSTIYIEKKDIEIILFKSGRKTIYNKPVLQTVSDDQWQTVLVTRDPKETEGLYKVGYFKAKSPRTSPNKKKAFEAAMVSLQKNAVKVKAYIVLIESEEYPGAYGDPPSCILEGSAWGLEPLEKGTNVTEDKGKKK
jgi:hypothetical protein